MTETTPPGGLPPAAGRTFADVLPEITKAATSTRYHLRRSGTEYDHALDLILSVDPDTVSITLCAKLLGVSRATLYRHLAQRVEAHADAR